MTIRNSSPLLWAIALSFLASPLFLSRADSDTNSAPSAATNAAPTPSTPAMTPSPSDTNSAPASPSSTERPTTYTVTSGDSLWTIAHKFDTTVVKMRKANNLKKGALLHPGQVLQIPPAKDDSSAK
jgi:LysM repeat protein